jgi:phosphate transport system permease protein
VARRVGDAVGRGLAWASAITLVTFVGGLVLWIVVKGLGQMSWSFLTKSPQPGSSFGLTGGIFDPLIGTLMLTIIGILIALPFGIAVPIFLSEYRKPAWLARSTELAVELLFGVPPVVFALFGVAVFTNPKLIFLSSGLASSDKAFGKSFIVAGVIMALLALPSVIRSTQEALQQVPRSMREASWALGKTRATTIRRLLLPEARSGFATGLIIAMGRIAGDTAIVVLLLGGTLTFEKASAWWYPGNLFSTLRGTGSTLTAYIFNTSGAGDLPAPQKSFGAALVLIVVILLLNGFVVLATRRFRWKKQSS